MFEKATRMKLRFNYRGSISVEDLWDLSLEDLDNLYGTLMETMSAHDKNTLMNPKKENSELALKIDIIKHVFETKQAEKVQRLEKQNRKLQQQKINEIIAKKQDAKLEEMSVEELMKMADSLSKKELN